MCRAFIVLCCAGAPLMAQTSSHRFSVDLSAGVGYGSGGDERTDRTGVATEIFAAWRSAADMQASGIIGIDAAWQWQFASDAICIVGRNNSCIPSYPTFNEVSVVAGGEWPMGANETMRLVAGAGDFIGTDEHGQRVSHAFGLVGRFDFSLPVAQHAAMVIGARYAAVPNLHGQFFGPAGFTAGLRLF